MRKHERTRRVDLPLARLSSSFFFAVDRRCPDPAGDSTAPSVVDPPLDDEVRRAALDGNTEKVERLLLPRLRAGTATFREARLLHVACKNNGHRACVEEVKAKHPDVTAPTPR